MRGRTRYDIVLDMSHRGPVDFGDLSPNITALPIQSLRWDEDNKQMLNVADFSEFYVEKIGSEWILHLVEVPESQLVSMLYEDKKFLINDDGIYRLSTQRERNQKEEDNIRSNFERKIKNKESTETMLILIFLLYRYIKTGEGKQIIEQIWDSISSLITTKELENDLIDFANRYKKFRQDRQSEIDNVGARNVLP